MYVRRMDDLGRIIIPKVIRQEMNIKEGDAFEIITTEVNGNPAIGIIKYQPSARAGFQNYTNSILKELELMYEYGLAEKFKVLAQAAEKVLEEVDKKWLLLNRL